MSEPLFGDDATTGVAAFAVGVHAAAQSARTETIPVIATFMGVGDDIANLFENETVRCHWNQDSGSPTTRQFNGPRWRPLSDPGMATSPIATPAVRVPRLRVPFPRLSDDASA
jgi:hypothetical protein